MFIIWFFAKITEKKDAFQYFYDKNDDGIFLSVLQKY